MARLAVTKCQGTGNDFVLLDHTSGASLAFNELARLICDRRFGIGADGLIVLAPASRASGADVAMRIFNADGSEAQMCGNGVRCVARYVYERRPGARKRLSIETPSGVVSTEVTAGAPHFAVRAAMGERKGLHISTEPVRVDGVPARVADVDVGNKHIVAFVDVDLESLDLPAFSAELSARRLTRTPVNVEVARPSGDSIAMRVFENGVGETWACGSGACAVAMAAIAMGRARSPVRVAMRGGDVVVEWGGPGQQAFMTGSAEIVFDAGIDVPDALVAPAAAPAM